MQSNIKFNYVQACYGSTLLWYRNTQSITSSPPAAGRHPPIPILSTQRHCGTSRRSGTAGDRRWRCRGPGSRRCCGSLGLLRSHRTREPERRRWCITGLEVGPKDRGVRRFCCYSSRRPGITEAPSLNTCLAPSRIPSTPGDLPARSDPHQSSTPPSPRGGTR